MKKLLKSNSGDSQATVIDQPIDAIDATFDWSNLHQDLYKHTVIELKQFLKELGLKYIGKKAELVKRLDQVRSSIVVREEIHEDTRSAQVQPDTQELKGSKENETSKTMGIEENNANEEEIKSKQTCIEIQPDTLEPKGKPTCILDPDSVFINHPEPDTFYCVLCGLHTPTIGGKVVLHFLKPVVESVDGQVKELVLDIPPLIPQEYKTSVLLCHGCVDRNLNCERLLDRPKESNQRNVLKRPLEVDEEIERVFGPLEAEDQVDRVVEDKENIQLQSPRRAYPPTDRLKVLQAIRNSPVIKSNVLFVGSPLKKRLDMKKRDTQKVDDTGKDKKKERAVKRVRKQ